MLVGVQVWPEVPADRQRVLRTVLHGPPFKIRSPQDLVQQGRKLLTQVGPSLPLLPHAHSRMCWCLPTPSSSYTLSLSVCECVASCFTDVTVNPPLLVLPLFVGRHVCDYVPSVVCVKRVIHVVLCVLAPHTAVLLSEFLLCTCKSCFVNASVRLSPV